eukprot:7420956-Pyramimonas_sp.AAC.1
MENGAGRRRAPSASVLAPGRRGPRRVGGPALGGGELGPMAHRHHGGSRAAARQADWRLQAHRAAPFDL